MSYPFIQTIRYMGNKIKLLDYIIPEIEKITNPGDWVCDIMAGTNCIGYALKKRNPIISNDIQYYSYVLAKCMLNNTNIPSIDKAHLELDSFIEDNKKNRKYTFFKDQYTDTYFSEHQCIDIDSIRYAIEMAPVEHKYFYLTILMAAMCKAQSTTGHFAQFMDKNHKRIIPLRALVIYDLFYSKIEEFKSFEFSDFKSIQYNLDYNELFKEKALNNVKCFYLDSPYTSDQYSRFYHILETVCKYDYPSLAFKAKYREDRVQSNFCYKNKVAKEFEKIISYCYGNNASLVISYSNHGVISPEEIRNIAKKYYCNVELKTIDFSHSSQGSGIINIKEVIIILKI